MSEVKKDQYITCKEPGCNTMFKFTVGEQVFYTDKGFNPPKRCPACRAKRKKQRQEQQPESSEHYMSRQTEAPWNRRY